MAHMTPLEINRLCERLIAYRDGQTSRADRDLLADVCNALDYFTKQTRALAAAPSAREVLADFMLQGHLTYRDMHRGSDYDRADAMIRDLAAEGLAIIRTEPKRSVDDFVEGGGDDGVERNPVPAARTT